MEPNLLRDYSGEHFQDRIIDVDMKRKRISLTMRKQGDEGQSPRIDRSARSPADKIAKRSASVSQRKKQSQSAFGAALAEALKRR